MFEGRGCWYYNGTVWSVFEDTLFKGTTAKQVLSTSTGMCGAVEFVNQEDSSRPGLFLADGVDAWIIDSTDAITRVDTRYLYRVHSTVYEEGDRVTPHSALNGYWYVCIVAGTTGTSTTPTFPTTPGDTLVDGTVTWRCEGTTSGVISWTGSTAYTIGNEVRPSTQSGYWYECTKAGTSATEPNWPLTIGDTVDDGTVTWTCKGQYGGFPTPHVASPTYMDGYIFLAEQDSIDIYNSDITTPFSWGALNFVSADNYSDNIVGLARQNNFLIAFGLNSTEFFYNYAKANQETDFDSPLDRFESLIMQTGSINKDAIMQTERILMFIGESLLGGHAVWRLDGTSAKEISTEYVEKFLDLETPSSGATGFGIRIVGHMLFVLNLPTADRTFIYDLEENIWAEWQYDGHMLPFVSFTDVNGVLVVQHATDGKLYHLDPLVYSDFDADIECRIRLSKQDFETDAYKFFQQTTVIGDSCEGNDILRWSDDDYATWSNDKVLNAGDRPYFMRSGKARRRAWELEYTHNSPRRLEALEVTYSIGEH